SRRPSSRRRAPMPLGAYPHHSAPRGVCVALLILCAVVPITACQGSSRTVNLVSGDLAIDEISPVQALPQQDVIVEDRATAARIVVTSTYPNDVSVAVAFDQS